jgi:hypothetical protein
MSKILLFIVVILFPLGICAQSAAKPQVDSRSAFEIILAKVRGAQEQALKREMSYAQPDPERVRRAENANNVVSNIKTRKSLIAFLLDPPDFGFTYEEPLRLQWVVILQNEQIAAPLEGTRPPHTSDRSIILQ